MKKVALAIPTADWKLGTDFVQSLYRAMEVAKQYNIICYFSFVSKEPISKARNKLLKNIVENEIDYCLFIDDDEIPEEFDFIRKFVETAEYQKVDLVTGFVRTKGKQWHQNLPIFFDNSTKEAKDFKYIKQPKSTKVDACWAWALLVSNNCANIMFSKYPMPFEYKVANLVENWGVWEEKENLNNFSEDNKEIPAHMSEWVLFTDRCRRLWFEIYADKEIKFYHMDNSWRFLKV